MTKPDVSFVMTVYNKEYYLPSVLEALFNQTGVKNPEYIFVDDCSKDSSVQIIEEMSKSLPNVKIFKNKDNRGISPRINQGIFAATGEYIRMLDSDDIFPLDSTQQMLELSKKHNADIVYGKFTKTGKEPQELTKEYMQKDFSYKYNKNALEAVLSGRFTRMGQLIKADVLKQAGGADEKVFIQDESIPLRAAKCAQGIIKMDANVVLVPKENGNLSGDKSQLNHDRFYAYYNFLLANKDLPKKIIKKVNARAVSAYWKQIRKKESKKFAAMCCYLWTKMFHPMPNYRKLEKMAKKMSSYKVLLPK